MPGLDTLNAFFLFLSFSRLVKWRPSPRGDKPTSRVGRSIIIVIIFLSRLQYALTFIRSYHSVFVGFAMEIERIPETFRTYSQSGTIYSCLKFQKVPNCDIKVSHAIQVYEETFVTFIIELVVHIDFSATL